jgi:hypothetical protein
MFFLLLRILLAPLAVLIGTVAQRRFGHAISGLIVGLPLASLPLLWLVALQHGTAFTSSMTGALLVGSIAEAVVLWLYARLTMHVSPLFSLAGTLAAFALIAGVVNFLKLSVILAAIITSIGFALALRLWPSNAKDTSARSGHSRLWLRLVLSAVFTLVIVSLAGRLGPVVSGLVDALPAMSLMMAFMTHQDHGAHASSTFLRGVTRGSFSYVVAMLVLAETLRYGNLVLAFALAMLAALAVQTCVQALDSMPRVKRALSFFPRTRVLDSSTVGGARDVACSYAD